MCRPSSSAASPCCTRTGSTMPAGRSRAFCRKIPAALWLTGEMRSTCLATPWLGRRRGPTPRLPGKHSRRRARSGQSERDWIEALSAYFRDHDKVPVDVRLRAYNSAMEQTTQRYPDDYEARVFYALTLQASASKADMTHANQLKSAAILEKL